MSQGTGGAEKEAGMAEPTHERLAAHARWLASAGAEGSRLDLSGADLQNAELAGVNLSRAVLSGADLYRARLAGANLAGCDLSAAFAAEADLTGADLTEAYLRRADFTEATLVDARLHRASCIRVDFSGADLTGADLSRAYLVKAVATGTRFVRANLAEADVHRLLLLDAVLDPSRVAGLRGTLGFAADQVRVVGDGAERQVTVAEAVEILNRHGAEVATWPDDAEPPDPAAWRWEEAERHDVD